MADAEQQLFAFGPFGVSDCEGPYGVFKWQKTNVTKVELTDRCIRGIPTRGFSFMGRKPRGGGPSFEIPYAAIVSVELAPHPAHLGLQQVLDIKYRDGEQIRERSIAAYNDPAQEAFAILQRHAPSPA